MKKLALLAAGFGCLIGGIALVILWWPFVVALFKGASGIVLAMAGMIVLMSVK